MVCMLGDSLGSGTSNLQSIFTPRTTKFRLKVEKILLRIKNHKMCNVDRPIAHKLEAKDE